MTHFTFVLLYYFSIVCVFKMTTAMGALALYWEYDIQKDVEIIERPQRWLDLVQMFIDVYNDDIDSVNADGSPVEINLTATPWYDKLTTKDSYLQPLVQSGITIHLTVKGKGLNAEKTIFWRATSIGNKRLSITKMIAKHSPQFLAEYDIQP